MRLLKHSLWMLPSGAHNNIISDAGRSSAQTIWNKRGRVRCSHMRAFCVSDGVRICGIMYGVDADRRIIHGLYGHTGVVLHTTACCCCCAIRCGGIGVTEMHCVACIARTLRAANVSLCVPDANAQTPSRSRQILQCQRRHWNIVHRFVSNPAATPCRTHNPMTLTPKLFSLKTLNW